MSSLVTYILTLIHANSFSPFLTGDPTDENDNGGREAGPCSLPDQVHTSPPLGRQVVHLPNLRLHTLPL